MRGRATVAPYKLDHVEVQFKSAKYLAYSQPSSTGFEDRSHHAEKREYRYLRSSICYFHDSPRVYARKKKEEKQRREKERKKKKRAVDFLAPPLSASSPRL